MFCRSRSLVTLIFTTGQVGAVGEPAGQELEEIRVYSVSNPDVSLLTSAISTCRTFLRDVFLPNFRKRSTLKTSFLRITPLNDDGQVKGELVRQIARDWMYACIRITRQFAYQMHACVPGQGKNAKRVCPLICQEPRPPMKSPPSAETYAYRHKFATRRSLVGQLAERRGRKFRSPIKGAEALYLFANNARP